MSRAFALLFAALGVTLAATGAAATPNPSALTPAERVSLSRFGTTGTPFALPADDRRTQRLRGSGYTDLERLATRGTTNFFRFGTTSGRSCYATGPVGAPWPLGSITCRFAEPSFPSPDVPILDDSVVEVRAEGATYLRVKGFAADGVTAVAVFDAQDRLVVRVPVSDNVYAAETVPRGGVRLEPLQADGRPVFG